MRHRHHPWGSRPSSRATTERTRPERLGRESQPQLPFSRSLNSGLTALNTRWKELESWRTESRASPRACGAHPPAIAREEAGEPGSPNSDATPAPRTSKRVVEPITSAREALRASSRATRARVNSL
jgi:hypothetical protein